MSIISRTSAVGAVGAVVVLVAGCGGTGREGQGKSGGSKSALLSDAPAGPEIPRLVVGTPARGALAASDPTLEDRSHFDRWLVQGRQGDRLRITLRSTAFDAYLIITTGDGDGEFLAEDDDGGGGTDAQLTFELPADGSYHVLANSYGGGEVGDYTLTVDAPGSARTTPAADADWARRYPGGGDPTERYALLVGINDYAGIANPLDGPVQDARLIARVLVERFGFLPANVVVLTDRDATREHVTQAFLRHLGQAGPEGVAVFYYSGHGTQMEGNVGVAADLDPEADGMDEALVIWGADGRGGVLLDDELGYLADRLSSERVLFILDACFSGTGTRGGAAGGAAKEVQFAEIKGNLTLPASYLTDSLGAAVTGAAGAAAGRDVLGEPERHVLLAASTDDQLSWTASGWPKYGGTISVFTYYLAEALEGGAAGATFAELTRSVREKTLAFTQRQYNARQTPQAEGVRATSAIATFLGRR